MTMKRGFIFDQLLCVNCKACSAACSLENKFPVKARNILNYNSELSASVAYSNLSVACNHCEVPVCLDGCPSSAYSRDTSSGAIIIDDTRCIGCKYCIWNCPFDAPQYDIENKVIGKCHFCYSRLNEGMEPACTSACPTGALSFGDLERYDKSDAPEWYPGNELNPGMRFRKRTGDILKIIPSTLFRKELNIVPVEKKGRESEWSLILFSFMSVLSVSMIFLSLITSKLPDKILFISLTVIPGIISLFHLGNWQKAWRAIINIKSSPLSREILAYMLYLILSVAAVTHGMPVLFIAASINGFFLLLFIDAVYVYTSRSLNAYFHSGQTFITALIIISFLSGSVLPFLFISSVKIILIIYRYNPQPLNLAVIKFVRLALLIVAGASIVTGISYPDTSIIIILLIGELTDRILFYYDFNPVGISDQINKHISRLSYEKKGD